MCAKKMASSPDEVSEGSDILTMFCCMTALKIEKQSIDKAATPASQVGWVQCSLAGGEWELTCSIFAAKQDMKI